MAWTLKAARSVCGTLGFPSKMPGTAYGLPASACITGSKLAAIEGTICSLCYAFEGNYQYSSVAKAQAKRLAGITSPQWVPAMVFLLRQAHGCNKKRRARGVKGKGKLSRHHRWHDAGDIQSRDHL